MKPLKEYPPLKLGVAAAAIIGALIVGSTAFGTIGLTDDRYEAELANAGGVRPGDEVRVAGIGVGEVTRTKLAGEKVIMSFRVRNDVDLGADTRVEVKLSTLLGGRYVDLQPRGTGEPADDRIRLSHTAVPFDLQSAVEAGTPALEKLDGRKLREALAASTETFREIDPELLDRSLAGITELSGIVTEREGQISRLLADTEAVTSTLNANRVEIFDLMGQGDRLLKELLQRRALIRSLLADFREITTQLSGMLEENRAQLKPMLANARKFTQLLARNDEAIGKALERFAPASRYLTNAAGNGPYLDLRLPYAILPDNLLCTAGVVKGCR